MPNLLTSNIRHKNIDNFLNTIESESVYFSFSNPEQWINENIPPTPNDNYSLTSDIFSDMLYSKKVSINNATRVIRNYNWLSGSRYTQYSDSEDILDLTRIKTFVPATATANLTGGTITSFTITNPGAEYTTTPNISFSGSGGASASVTISSGSVFSINIINGGTYVTPPTVTIDPPSVISNITFQMRPFYVITDEFKVYKCISNNSGAISTIKPTSTSTTAGVSETTADGYQWKYMYTINTTSLERFYTSSWVPVKTLREDDGSDAWDIQTSALSGSVPYHGSDPEKELGGTSLMVKVRVSGSEGGLITDENDYRQISLILNPIVSESYYTVGATGFGIPTQIGLNPSHNLSDTSAPYFPSSGKKIKILTGKGSNQIREIISRDGQVLTIDSPWKIIPDTNSEYGIIASPTVINQALILELNPVTGTFVQDSTVTQANTGATGKVVKYDSTSTPKKIYLTSLTGVFSDTDTISSGAVSGTVTGKIDPTLISNFVDVIYTENRKAIIRASDQIEDVKVIIQY
jgi:hypothetical protein